MFNLFFAGATGKNAEYLSRHPEACRLYSYLNDKKSIERFYMMKPRGKLMIDSGAFSVAHSGKSVDIDDYINFINRHPEVEHFIELDVIPYPILNKETAEYSAKKSWENYLYMIERLDNPYVLMPVFHFGESIEYLRQMLNFNYKGKFIPFICIGGRHGVSEKIQSNYFYKIFYEIENSSNPNVKVHVLGMTILSILEKFPFYSADSTTWLKQGVVGTILTKKGIIPVSNRKDTKNCYDKLSNNLKQAVEKEVNELGYNINSLVSCDYQKQYYNIDYVMRWAKNYEYKGPKSFKFINKLF